MKQKKIIFKLHKETELPQDFIDSVPQSGPADDSVDWMIKNYDIEVSEQDCIDYLKHISDWDLSDHEANLGRLIWLACLDCRENETTYFYMGS